MTELVQQKSESDCMLACLAMASGREYLDIFDPTFVSRVEAAQTCSGELLIEAYSRAGFVQNQNMWVVYVGVGREVAVAAIRSLIQGRRAIIQVPSLNRDKAEHFVYWDGSTLYDPSPKSRHISLQSIFPTYITIFDELSGEG